MKNPDELEIEFSGELMVLYISLSTASSQVDAKLLSPQYQYHQALQL
jgi:hypothetical protein